ncbi:MAG: aldo/keto reductase [Planctomycetota bacterium]
MKRRTFISAVGGAVAGASLSTARAEQLVAEKQAETGAMERNAQGIPLRVLGRTGEKIPIVGFPGLGLVHDDDKTCIAAVRSALETGVNYLDNAPAYGKTECERKMGLALEGIDRDSYFLACKTKMRDAKGCQEEMDRSMKLLKTDRFDLYQLHHLRQPAEAEQALGPGGAMETILKAKEQGKIKYIGFSAHTTRGALAAMKGFKFDTVMFPINFVEYFTLGFGKAVLELAREQGAAVLAIKPLSRGNWPADMERTRKWWYRPIEDQHEMNLALRFTLSLPGVVAGIPPAWLDIAARAFEEAKSYTPITPEETEEVRKLAAQCFSTFRKEEEQVAFRCPHSEPLYADSPYEDGCPGMMG